MAGGRSERMRARGDPTHKAMVAVSGATLAERSLRALLGHGFRSLAIAVSAAETALVGHVREDLVPLARRAGGSLRCIAEARPLGTIGAVREIAADAADAVLVVNVDNLTTLDLAALVAHHRRCGAALTIASHLEPVPLPFGVLELCAGRVNRYAEKPVHRVRASSGTYVLSAQAIGTIACGEPIGVPQLFERLRERGLGVAAFEHDAAWVDVNDAASLERAARLVAREAPVG